MIKPLSYWLRPPIKVPPTRGEIRNALMVFLNKYPEQKIVIKGILNRAGFTTLSAADDKTALKIYNYIKNF